MRSMVEAHQDAAPPPPSPSDRLRAATTQLHTRAERSGFVAEMLRGKASREGYALFIRNLLPAYVALEEGLGRLAESPVVGPLAEPAIYRAAALEADLHALAGPSWRQSLPLLPAGRDYAGRIAAVAEAGSGEGLVAHAYVRYLGDLNGGRVLARLLARNLGLDPSGLSFYAFPAIDDLATFRIGYRARIDAAADAIDDIAAVVAETRTAFALNIAVSEAVVAGPPGRDPARA